jgi:hypothetical protein
LIDTVQSTPDGSAALDFHSFLSSLFFRLIRSSSSAASLKTAAMPTKLMMVFVGLDFLFAGCGGLVLGFSLMAEQSLRNTPSVDNVTQNVLLGQCPLTGTTASY